MDRNQNFRPENIKIQQENKNNIIWTNTLRLLYIRMKHFGSQGWIDNEPFFKTQLLHFSRVHYY